MKKLSILAVLAGMLTVTACNEVEEYYRGDGVFHCVEGSYKCDADRLMRCVKNSWTEEKNCAAQGLVCSSERMACVSGGSSGECTTVDELRCFGNELKKCGSDRRWTLEKDCGVNGCDDALKACKNPSGCDENTTVSVNGVCVNKGGNTQCDAKNCPQDANVCINNTCIPKAESEVCKNCGDNQVCINGVCVPRSGPEKCDPECGDSQVCINGMCVPNKATCTQECAGNTACLNNVCVATSSLYACKPEAGENEVCVNGVSVPKGSACSADCQKDEVCVNGKCLSGGGNVCPATCEAGKTCFNGACVENATFGNVCDPKCTDEEVCFRKVCVPKGSAQTCKNCTDEETCLNGVCVVEDKSGCTGENACDSHHVCIANECVPLGGPATCESACEAGKSCVNGKCVTQDAACTKTCGEQEVCLKDQCVPAHSALTCKDKNCVAGEICLNGVCVNAGSKNCEPVCGAASVCIDGQCVASGGVSACDGENACSESQVCINGACAASDLCGGCGDNKICINGKCVPNRNKLACEPKCPSSFECLNGSCVDSRSKVVECDPACKTGTVCLKGLCVPEQSDNMCNQTCASGKVCLNGACVTQGDSNCKPACNNTEICVNGACIPKGGPSTCSPACGDNKVCVNGACVPKGDSCTPQCPSHKVCINASCVAKGSNEVCEDPVCEPKIVCLNGVCLDPNHICSPKCNDNQICKQGACIDKDNKCKTTDDCKGTGVCDTKSGKCVKCTETEGCGNDLHCRIDGENRTCEKCTDDSHCGTQVCDKANFVCTDCYKTDSRTILSENCGTEKTVCHVVDGDAEANVCGKPCTSATDICKEGSENIVLKCENGIETEIRCEGEKAYCLKGGCVQCLDKNHCPGNKDRCDNGICVADLCQEDDDCTETYKCDQSVSPHKCVECLDNATCQNKGKIRCDLPKNKTCVGCTDNTDCNGHPNGAVCETVQGICIECKSDTDCNGNPKGAFCDTTNNKCVGCTSNEQCPSGSCADNNCTCRPELEGNKSACVDLTKSVACEGGKEKITKCVGNEKCVLTLGKCVENGCNGYGDCPSPGEYCNAGSGKCEALPDVELETSCNIAIPTLKDQDQKEKLWWPRKMKDENGNLVNRGYKSGEADAIAQPDYDQVMMTPVVIDIVDTTNNTDQPDGIPEIILIAYKGNDWNQAGVIRIIDTRTGKEIVTSEARFSGLGAGSLAAGDIDRDGKIDIVAFDMSNIQNTVLKVLNVNVVANQFKLVEKYSVATNQALAHRRVHNLRLMNLDSAEANHPQAEIISEFGIFYIKDEDLTKVSCGNLSASFLGDVFRKWDYLDFDISDIDGDGTVEIVTDRFYRFDRAKGKCDEVGLAHADPALPLINSTGYEKLEFYKHVVLADIDNEDNDGKKIPELIYVGYNEWETANNSKWVKSYVRTFKINPPSEGNPKFSITPKWVREIEIEPDDQVTLYAFKRRNVSNSKEYKDNPQLQEALVPADRTEMFGADGKSGKCATELEPYPMEAYLGESQEAFELRKKLNIAKNLFREYCHPTVGHPVVGKANGDEIPDIGIATGKAYMMFNGADGMRLWSRRDGIIDNSMMTGSTIIDLDADGKAEVIYGDEKHTYIFNGETGTTVIKIPNTNDTQHENPVVADIDSDGTMDILVTSSYWRPDSPPPGYHESRQNGLRAYSSKDWAGTGKVWNQYDFYVSNIDPETGMIPEVEKSWAQKVSESLSIMRLNKVRSDKQKDQANLIPGPVELEELCKATKARIRATVMNNGKIPVSVPVTFYGKKGESEKEAIETKYSPVIPVGEKAYVEIEWDNTVTRYTKLFFTVDAFDSVHECGDDKPGNNNDSVAISAPICL